ncbi:hypothetical protein G647_03913 [Cladophialophora carrionii CBS 160.54]|uniref:Apple domain-containing protein n=1 Tax=Cladophialophora carrionii CBS 160.54 TaxID=1279043 RepID=V9DCB8_9EURO|nr:uncharacterized protein G647_03913 [Cladophialophora carrionii CBS 160.54]ETI24544.1 hypothetical protein G647_03913 [Cladophialophora carrionii CBS 160.54]
MSNKSATSAVNSPDPVRESMATSSATTEKYPASSTTTGYQSYPEVAPIMTQPPLQPFQQPHNGYTHPQQYHDQNGDPPEAGRSIPQTPKRNPWGLSPLAFGLLVAAVTAVIVGAAVGGGVAGAMSGNDSKASKSNATATVTITATSTATATTAIDISSPTDSALPLPSSLENYVVSEPYYVSTLFNPGCPDSNSRIDVQYDTSFDLFCGVDMQNHVDDEANPDLQVADVSGLFAYSITDCLYACANAIYFNEQWGDEFGGCKGVTWQYQMAQSNSSDFANCWLKNGTSTGFQCNTCISAKLVT